MSRLKRATCTNIILKLIEKSIAINNKTGPYPFPQQIEKIIVSGSYINGKSKIIDDFEITAVINENKDEWNEFNKKYPLTASDYNKYYVSADRKFRNFLSSNQRVDVKIITIEEWQPHINSNERIVFDKDNPVGEFVTDNTRQAEHSSNEKSNLIDITGAWKLGLNKNELRKSLDTGLSNKYGSSDYLQDYMELRAAVQKELINNWAVIPEIINIVIDKDNDILKDINEDLLNKGIYDINCAVCPNRIFKKRCNVDELIHHINKKVPDGVGILIKTISEDIVTININKLLDDIIYFSLYDVFSFETEEMYEDLFYIARQNRYADLPRNIRLFGSHMKNSIVEKCNIDRRKVYTHSDIYKISANPGPLAKGIVDGIVKAVGNRCLVIVTPSTNYYESKGAEQSGFVKPLHAGQMTELPFKFISSQIFNDGISANLLN